MVITTEVMNIQGELKFRIMPNKGSNMWPESPVEAEVSQSDRVRLGGDFLDWSNDRKYLNQHFAEKLTNVGKKLPFPSMMIFTAAIDKISTIVPREKVFFLFILLLVFYY